MPNHVTTNVRITGPRESLEKMFDETMTKDEYGEFKLDFRKIVPPPSEVVESAEMNEMGVMPLWYRWNCSHWGTKWNNYGPETSRDGIRESQDYDGKYELEFTLMTAWSFPEPIFDALAEKYRDLAFHAEYADEDVGSNCGTLDIWWSDYGVLKDVVDKDGNYEFACKVLGYDYGEWKAEREN